MKKTQFEPYATKGKLFIEMWNNANSNGIQKQIAKHFEISIAQVYRIRKKLNLLDLDDKNHPGRKKLIKRIIKLYLKKDRSSTQIGLIVGLSSQHILNILHKSNIIVRETHINNVSYFATKSHLTPHKLLIEIKRLYLDEKYSAHKIAEICGINQETVRNKLKALNIKIRNNKHKYVKSNDKCQWCNNVMEHIYHNTGARKQLYCNSKCSNFAKDYRRMIKGKRVSINRLNTMELFLKQSWKDQYNQAKDRILNVTPIITIK